MKEEAGVLLKFVDLQYFVIKTNSIESRFNLIQSVFNSIERQSNLIQRGFNSIESRFSLIKSTLN